MTSCPATAECACGRVYPCPLPEGHETDHPTRLDECSECREQNTHGRPPARTTATT